MSLIDLRITFVPTKFRRIPPGKYKVRLIEIKEGIGIVKQIIFIFVFEICEGEYKKNYCNSFVNAAVEGEYGIGNKLGRIATALDPETSLGERDGIKQLIGKECYAEIAVELHNDKPINRIVDWERL